MFFDDEYNPTGLSWFLGVLVIVVVIAMLVLSPFTIVSPGYRALVVTFGRVDDAVLQEGFHVISPFSNTVHMEVKTQKIETGASAASKDLQTVNATIALNYHLNDSVLVGLYKNVGKEYESKLIAPAIQESVKAATALFTAEEMVTRRSEVSDKIREVLSGRLDDGYFDVEAINIVNFDFSPEFNAAIERKVTAEQEALASKNKLEQVKYESEQRVVQAKAEAEAIRIQAQSVSQQGGADYVKLKWVEKWDGKLPTTSLGEGTSVIIGQ